MLFDTVVNAKTGRRHRSLTRRGVVEGIQERPMAKSYRTVQPRDVFESFRRAGFETALVSVGRNPWNQAVTFRDRNETPGEYAIHGSVLCGHDGRTALRITPNLVRGFCANEFTGAPISIRHTSKEIDAFLADPVDMAVRCLEQARYTADHLETLRAARVPGDDTTLRFWLRHAKKRNLLRSYRRTAMFHGEDWSDGSLWGILQRLTATRSPTMIRLASEALQVPEVNAGDFDGWLYRKLSKGRPKGLNSLEMADWAATN